MKYVQYDFSDEPMCWHIIFWPSSGSPESDYDTTFCDGIWQNKPLPGNVIESSEPLFLDNICQGCIAEILDLNMNPRPEWWRLAEGWHRNEWFLRWKTMPDEEKQKYLAVARHAIGAVDD